ncbi:MAG: helix-turn-helix domain-containing protein [Oscillospiraceae bacterium]
MELKFGERLRTVRKNAGCNQKEFCALLEIPQSTLSAYETDRMHPTVFILVKIAKKFNVSLDWLCGIDKQHISKFLDNKSIGLRIRALRLERGLTQTDFANTLGKALRTIQKYEKGDIEITISTVNEIAQIMGVSTAYFLCNDDNAAENLSPTEVSIPRVIKLTGKDFTAEIPADVSPELMTVLLDKIGK